LKPKSFAFDTMNDLCAVEFVLTTAFRPIFSEIGEELDTNKQVSILTNFKNKKLICSASVEIITGKTV